MNSVFLSKKSVQITAIMTAVETDGMKTITILCTTSEEETALVIKFVNINITKKEYKVGLQKAAHSKIKQISVCYIRNGIIYENAGNGIRKSKNAEPQLPGIITITDYTKGKEIGGNLNLLLFSKANPKKIVHISGAFNAMFVSVN